MESVIAEQPLKADNETARKPRFATVWLGGCSGCHMSFLDVDEWVLELAGLVDVVYTPIADIKVFPEDVDIALVEGAIANEDNLEIIKQVRKNSKLLIAFGDCAVTGNVTALRNPIGTANEVLKAVYVDSGDLNGQIPSRAHTLPVLLEAVKPLHEVVKVDAYLHGCPPSAKEIRKALEAVLAGTTAAPAKFG
jgi:NAD-reducing hydrogenase small subunit